MIPSSQCDGRNPETGRHLDNRLMASSLFKASKGTYLLTKKPPPQDTNRLAHPAGPCPNCTSSAIPGRAVLPELSDRLRHQVCPRETTLIRSAVLFEEEGPLHFVLVQGGPLRVDGVRALLVREWVARVVPRIFFFLVLIQERQFRQRFPAVPLRFNNRLLLRKGARLKIDKTDRLRTDDVVVFL